MGGMDNRTSRGFAKDRRAGAHRARSFYKGCYEEFLADPSAQYLMTYSEYKRKWSKDKWAKKKQAKKKDAEDDKSGHGQAL